MTIFMYISAATFFLLSLTGLVSAKTSIHEIFYAILLVPAVILLVGAAISSSVNRALTSLRAIQASSYIKSTTREESTAVEDNSQTHPVKTKACLFCDAEIPETAALCPKCGKILKA